ncbi:peptide chain release factor N(5)-glutamine methyltransferase [Polaribacter porphyrae]|uniref:Release factor glutamine methyltransferase n=1 Tax=Polaribacter porphyrae TaxID=1137780 RepID=A0A2S7WMG6_9FLAO|nr:peptide chain release factor N(5)-glutamine methyltransferase [Polaribacter porphyrae]PQJ78798.1 protein-(glutamine-N5) methyltransferase, release factor-specific [Polaribacter porphyrae]
MKIIEFKKFFIDELIHLYPKTEIDTFFFLLMDDYLNFQRIDTVLNANLEIKKEQLTILNKALKRLQKEEPIQYILGKTEFYGLPFLVDKNTLIPRPETEELVEWILSEIKNKDTNLSILDIGTGTGCIPISLAKHLPNATIYTIDVSSKALKIAKQNANLNNVKIHFIEANILQVNNLNEVLNQNFTFDIIASNPPYVRELEKVEIKNNVLQNEPHLALFVPDKNPLLFYNKIADIAKNHLTKNGVLFFEINQYLGNETRQLIRKKRFTNIELKKDLFGNDRMIRAKN